MEWIYDQPVKIIFGLGKISELENLCKEYQRPMIVCDKFFAASDFIGKLKKMLGTHLVYSDISPNPDVTEVNRCAAMIRQEGADILVAVGGGSAIDLTKAASLAAEHIEEYHGTGKAVPEEHLPVVAVPTTSGTGSEVTCVSVLTDRSGRNGAQGRQRAAKKGTEGIKKCPINSPSFYPVAAVIDPELTLSVPPKVTASTGIDVLCHAIEGYWSKGHQPICDALAVHAAKLVFEYLPKAYTSPGDILAREKLSEASVIAGLAFTIPLTTASHACSFPLTSIYGIPHGEACGLTLDFFARVNGADGRTQELAGLLGFSDAEDLADHILDLKVKVRLRTDLADLALKEEQIMHLVQKSHHPNLKNNPVTVTDDMLYDLYHSLQIPLLLRNSHKSRLYCTA